MGADPDTKYTPAGVAVTNISIGCNDEWRDKQSGEKQSRTEWVRAVLFGKLGEIAAEYLRKGSKVYIAGRLQTDKYTDKEGIERYSTKVVVSDLLMLDGRPRDDAPAKAPTDDFEMDDAPF
jgi:single-strand DNA-binding protein